MFKLIDYSLEQIKIITADIKKLVFFVRFLSALSEQRVQCKCKDCPCMQFELTGRKSG